MATNNSTNSFQTRIKQKRDTAANWTKNNPVLLNGEMAVVDTSSGEVRLKIGNGTSAYNSLPFLDEIIKQDISNLTTEVETKANTLSFITLLNDNYLNSYTYDDIQEIDYTISQQDYEFLVNNNTIASYMIAQMGDDTIAGVLTRTQFSEVFGSTWYGMTGHFYPSNDDYIAANVEVYNNGNEQYVLRLLLKIVKYENGTSNLENGEGEASIQQIPLKAETFDFSSKNPYIEDEDKGELEIGAVGEYSVAFGGKSRASGEYSIVLGSSNLATSKYSMAIGSSNYAKGQGGLAGGYKSIAKGTNSIALGNQVQALGGGAIAEGDNTKATGDYQHVQGKYNIEDANLAHIVGGGTSTTNRKNIYTLDWSGNGSYDGTVVATDFITKDGKKLSEVGGSSSCLGYINNLDNVNPDAHVGDYYIAEKDLLDGSTKVTGTIQSITNNVIKCTIPSSFTPADVKYVAYLLKNNTENRISRVTNVEKINSTTLSITCEDYDIDTSYASVSLIEPNFMASRGDMIIAIEDYPIPLDDWKVIPTNMQETVSSHTSKINTLETQANVNLPNSIDLLTTRVNNLDKSGGRVNNLETTVVNVNNDLQATKANTYTKAQVDALIGGGGGGPQTSVILKATDNPNKQFKLTITSDGILHTEEVL